MSARLGLLLSCFDYSPVAEDEFHDWYDTEHIPERERVPGFMQCRRWLAVDRAQAAVATYDLAAVDVLRSPGYLAIGYQNNSPWTRRVGWRCIKLLRFEGEQIVPGDALSPPGAGALLVWAFNLEGVSQDALTEWHARTHTPLLMREAGVIASRLFRATSSTHDYAALYHLATADAVRGDAWQRGVEQAWASRFGSHERERFRLLARSYTRSVGEGV